MERPVLALSKALGYDHSFPYGDRPVLVLLNRWTIPTFSKAPRYDHSFPYGDRPVLVLLKALE